MDVRAGRAAETEEGLLAAVRVALGEPAAALTVWQAAPLGMNAGMFAMERRLYLLTGTARAGAVERPFRLVLKVFTPAPDRHDPVRIDYWQREALLYRSGVLEDLPGSLRAPRCYRCDEHADGTIWLWLEYVGEEGEGDWPLTRWAVAARHLGQFNGAYLGERPLPAAPWLGGRRLRTWLEGHGRQIRQITAAPQQPSVRQWWPQPVVDAILQLWDEREVFCAALERLPQTFCHGDAIRRNLFACRAADGSEQTVAIDWEYAGYMAAGEEVGQTLSVAGAFFDVDPRDLPALDVALFAGYLDGLRDASWHGSPRPVRFAYAAHAALRNLFNAVGTNVPTDEQRAVTLQHWGHSWEALAERRAVVRPFLLERAREARRLLESL
jgi:hypothetical protein